MSEILITLATFGAIVWFIVRWRRLGKQPPPPIGAFTILSFGSLGLVVAWSLVPTVLGNSYTVGSFCYENSTLAMLAGLIILVGSEARIVLARRSGSKLSLRIASLTSGVAASLLVLAIFIRRFTLAGRVCIGDDSLLAISLAFILLSVVFATIGLFQKRISLPQRLLTLGVSALALAAFAAIIIAIISASVCPMC